MESLSALCRADSPKHSILSSEGTSGKPRLLRDACAFWVNREIIAFSAGKCDI
jgi:hypothetical protein